MSLQEQVNRLEKEVEQLKTFVRGANRGAITPLSADSADRNRFKQIIFAKKTIDFGSRLTLTQASDTVLVIGARLGDVVLVGVPNGAKNSTGLVYTAHVSANDTVTLECANVDDNTIDPGSGEFTIVVLKL